MNNSIAWLGAIGLSLAGCLATPLAGAATPNVHLVSAELSALIETSAHVHEAFAVPIADKITLSDGVWLIDGTEAVWTETLSVPTARSISFKANPVVIPASGSIVLRNSSLAFTHHAQDWARGILWSRVVPGDTMTVEIHVPVAAKEQVKFTITEVQAGYKDLSGSGNDHPAYKKALKDAAHVSPKARDTGAPTSCDHNYQCSASSSTQNQANAVVAVVIGNTSACTGTLLNDTASDFRPFISLASHCNYNLSGDSRNAFVFYWNAVTPCNQTLQYYNVSDTATSQGGTERARYQDALLIEADAQPPLGANPYWAGVDTITTDKNCSVSGGITTCSSANPLYVIHHGGGYSRQYTTSELPFTQTQIQLQGYDYKSQAWAVKHNYVNDGRLWGGSSGAALFYNGRVIGADSGADNESCSTDSSQNETSYYQRMDISWPGDGTSAGSLKYWLDPSNTGATVYDGAADPSRSGIPTINLTLNPVEVTAGNASTLSWTSTVAASCSLAASIGTSGAVAVNSSQNIDTTDAAAGNYDFTLSCPSENSQTASQKVTLKIDAAPTPPPAATPTVSLSTNTTSVTTGDTIVLTWSSTSATLCAASGAWSGALATSGTQMATVSAAGSNTYTLACTGFGGTATQSVVVTASAPITPPPTQPSPQPSSSTGGGGGSMDLWIAGFLLPLALRKRKASKHARRPHAA